MEQINGDYHPDIPTVKFHLTQKYRDNVLITTTRREENAVCFNWYQQKRSSKQEVRIRIVKTAASIMLEDIRLRKTRRSGKWRKKRSAIAHYIISAARPKSFISGMWVGSAAFLYKKYGSGMLIDVLSSLGFCSSCTEVVRLEVSSIMSSPVEISDKLFSQFVYGNADLNTQALDENNDGESILPDDLVEASLSLHVEEDTEDVPEDIGP
ncbi:hypothetical protein AVEN_74222-1 [Araneus ventricosus]|uniref:Uncharacterized protein n=1 Tax=Araneus ventricosus TaxID=182803 RepID=A0A4Y2EV77_ARAVE|nr:hypothetical protein AVEN_74222-1 [Araneus ventricosus]